MITSSKGKTQCDRSDQYLGLTRYVNGKKNWLAFVYVCVKEKNCNQICGPTRSRNWAGPLFVRAVPWALGRTNNTAKGAFDRSFTNAVQDGRGSGAVRPVRVVPVTWA